MIFVRIWEKRMNADEKTMEFYCLVAFMRNDADVGTGSSGTGSHMQSYL